MKYIPVLFFALIIAGCGTTAPSLVSANVREAQQQATAIVRDAQEEATHLAGTTIAQAPISAPTEAPLETEDIVETEEVVIETEAPVEGVATEESIVTEEAVTETEEAIATEEVASEADDSNEESTTETEETGTQSPAALLVSVASAENGAELFAMFQADAGFACSTCHRADSEDRLIGPGLLNIGQRAADRIEGEDAATYIYMSIMNPDAYVVDTFTDDLMPENWGEIYSQAEIYDIVAYLMTLEGESDASTDTGETVATVEIPVSELPETADAEHGAELFQMFQADAGFACSTCHWNDREDRLIGPGLLNVSVRAETRVEGQNSFEYLYTSIVSPDEYLVADFPDDLMPENWAEIYSDEDIYDIIAYLMTLTE